MSNIDKLIEVKTKILIKDSEEISEEQERLSELGIEIDISRDDYEEKDVYYYFDATSGIHEIRETYIPYKDTFEKVSIITFSEGFLQSPPLFINIKELISKIKEVQ